MMKIRKKSLLIKFLIFISSYISAQDVQDTFHGVKFRASEVEVARAFDQYSEWKDIRSNEILFGDVHFAGEVWDIARCTFYGNMFYYVSFEKHFHSKDIAMDLYKSIGNRLVDKYDIPYSDIDWETSSRSIVTSFKGDNQVWVYIDIHFSESKGGKMYWYVTLAYWDDFLGRLDRIRQDEDL